MPDLSHHVVNNQLHLPNGFSHQLVVAFGLVLSGLVVTVLLRVLLAIETYAGSTSPCNEKSINLPNGFDVNTVEIMTRAFRFFPIGYNLTQRWILHSVSPEMRCRC